MLIMAVGLSSQQRSEVSSPSFARQSSKASEPTILIGDYLCAAFSESLRIMKRL